MDTLIIDGLIMKKVINTAITKLCKKKFGCDPKFSLIGLKVDTPKDDANMLSVDLKFTIRKTGIGLIIESIKED